jgi:hypothetical protein
LSDADNIARLHTLLKSRPEERRLLEVVTGFARAQLTEHDAEWLSRGCFYAQKKPSDIRLCTEGFLTKEDIRTNTYLALRFAQLVCSMGFDGWVIGTNLVRADLSPFHAEVMLCNPNEKVTPDRHLHCSAYARIYHQAVPRVFNLLEILSGIFQD